MENSDVTTDDGRFSVSPLVNDETIQMTEARWAGMFCSCWLTGDQVKHHWALCEDTPWRTAK